MKKVLRFLGVLLLVIIAGVLIMGLIAPKEVTMERSMVINAPQNVVSEQMLNLNNFAEWNAWRDYDTNTQVTVTGDRTTGSSYEWKSEEIGAGKMTITEATANETKMDMVFLEPWESTAKINFRVEDAGNGQSKAVWGYSSHYGFPTNGLMMLMNVKGMLSKDFDKGLEKLKTRAEARAKDAPAAGSFKIDETQFPGGAYASIRQKMNTQDMEAMHKFFGDSYEKLGKAVGPNISGPASSLVYSWDEATSTTDMAAAFPVKKGTVSTVGTMANVPASRAYKMVYTGPYGGFMDAHMAMGAHLAEKGEKQGLVIEEYIKGPMDEADSNKYMTNIIYLVENK